MLGVGAFLARYSLPEKPSESLAEISNLVQDDYGRIYGHPRTNPFARTATYYNVLKRTKTKVFSFMEGTEPLYIARPYLDGVWFYGSNGYPTSKTVDRDLLFSVQELLYCAIIMLRIVAALRVSKAYSITVSGSSQGTQGSTWFLEDFTKRKQLFQLPSKPVGIRDAQVIVHSAVSSVHYMLDELRRHQEKEARNERKETIFFHLMCDYLIWMDYFHLKLLKCRVAAVRRRVTQEQIQPYWATRTSGIERVHKGVVTLRTGNLVRKGTAERIYQLKIGTIIPILTTAGTLLAYLCLQPLAYGMFDLWYARTVAGIAYVLAATSMGLNLAFGVWLLLPAGEPRPVDLVR